MKEMAIRLSEEKVYYVAYERDEICGIFCDENDCRSKQFVVLQAEKNVLTLPTHIQDIRIIGVKDFWCMGGQRSKTPYIRGLIVPETYRYIGKKNFSQYPSLEFVYLPGNVRLRSFAFAYCPRLEKVFVGSPNSERPWHPTSLSPESIYKGDLFDSHPHGIFERCQSEIAFLM